MIAAAKLSSKMHSGLPAGKPPAAKILAWYDAHARDLPWRVSPKDRKSGVRPDPYRVWLSEIMLQQTTVATVAPRYGAFLARWPHVEAMARAPLDDVLGAWAGLGYYARARNLHKCAVEIAERHDGVFPSTEAALRALPGVGAYTAAAVAAIAFDERAIVIDGNIERVTARLFGVATPLPKAKAEIRQRLETIWPPARSGDFAQALMDLGAGVCRARNPQCAVCPCAADCIARKRGMAETLPVRPPRGKKPTRHGAVFVLIDKAGRVLFERRPPKGLLGGMLGLPGGPWREESGGAARACDDAAHAPAEAVMWRFVGQARHTFTHFHLLLRVYAGPLQAGEPSGLWISPTDAKLPTVMKKALKIGLASDHD